MPLLDSTLSQDGMNVGILFFADFADLPLYGAYAPMPLTVPTGLADADADCEGVTFPTVNSDVLQIAPIKHSNGGSDALGFVLNADQADPDLLTAIENTALYLGRRVRIWLVVYADNGQVTQLRPIYRGYMTVPSQRGSSDEYVITMEAENWAGLLSQAQGRTYLNSTLWDSGDTSGAVMRGQAGSSVPGSFGSEYGMGESGQPQRFEP